LAPKNGAPWPFALLLLSQNGGLGNSCVSGYYGQMSKQMNRFSLILLSGIAVAASVFSFLWAREKTGSIEKKMKVHRLESTKRSPFDAFVYVNRIPEAAEEGDSPGDFAGYIFGHLANQEGRIELKLPPGMDRNAYLGFKTFLGSEGNEQVKNCVSCHAPPDFTDAKKHIVAKGGSPKVTPSLRNLKKRKVDLRKVLRDKIFWSQEKRSGKADDIDEAYGYIKITEADIPNLTAFLGSLDDVADGDFRDLIINVKTLDTREDIEQGPVAPAPAVTGIVRFEGPRPKRKPLNLTPESRKLYKTTPLDENILVSASGGVANVFVYIIRGVEKKDFPMPKEPVVLNQVKSMFRPRVQGVRVGQEFLTKNSDPHIHNVRSLSFRNRAFNIAQPANSPDRSRIFKNKEGPIKMICDFHKWMTAFIFVMDHPYFAVTDQSGRFRIEGLPPGDYTLAAWHEVFGDQEQEFTVGEGFPDVNIKVKFGRNK